MPADATFGIIELVQSAKRLKSLCFGSDGSVDTVELIKTVVEMRKSLKIFSDPYEDEETNVTII